MVIWGISKGVMLFEIINPAKMLPTANRLIGLINFVSSSFAFDGGGNRGLFRRE